MAKRRTPPPSQAGDHDDAYEPLPGEFAAEAPTGEGKQAYSSGPEQTAFVFASGTKLVNDHRRGMYLLRFSPELTEELYEQALANIRPLLDEQAQLSGEGKVNRTTKFYPSADNEREFQIRYRFVHRDANGNPILKADGVGKKYVDYHNQVSVIAERVVGAADGFLAEKQGKTASQFHGL